MFSQDISCCRNESFTQLAALHVLRFILTPNKPGENTVDKRQANSCFSTTLSISEVCSSHRSVHQGCVWMLLRGNSAVSLQVIFNQHFTSCGQHFPGGVCDWLYINRKLEAEPVGAQGWLEGTNSSFVQ